MKPQYSLLERALHSTLADYLLASRRFHAYNTTMSNVEEWASADVLDDRIEHLRKERNFDLAGHLVVIPLMYAGFAYQYGISRSCGTLIAVAAIEFVRRTIRDDAKRTLAEEHAYLADRKKLIREVSFADD
ncbi:MAG TPA: hypothetical protein VK158_03260 [Acidobacteriota bacterium]|nr:hypothetical protein [Acidobacteriota bacterium]